MKIQVKVLKKPWSICDNCFDKDISDGEFATINLKIYRKLNFKVFDAWFCPKHWEEFKQDLFSKMDSFKGGNELC